MDNKVLVILASYNGEKYIEEQLNSLLRQKGVNIQILVRDDGSTDKTQRILEDYKKRGKIQWYTGAHLNVKLGFFDLMKKAEKIEFDYIAFCDQDDVWDEDKLIIAVNMLNQYNKAELNLYYAGQRLVDEKLCFLEEHFLNQQRNNHARFVLNDAAGCTMVFNRTLLNKINEYLPEFILMHDAWVVKVCLGLGGNLIVDQETHIMYRQHGNNVVGLKNNFKSKLIRVKQYIYKQDVESQMIELEKGYKKEIIPEYRELIEAILNYKNNFKYRKKLMNREWINFADGGLQLTYYLKILLNKL